MATNGLNLLVAADTAQATAALKNISSQIEHIAAASQGGFHKASEGVIRFRGAVESAVVIAQKLVSLATSPIREFKDGARQATIMTSTIKLLGDGLDITTSSMLEMAEAFAESTTFSADAVVGVEQLLVSTKALSKEGVQQATEATLDMATAMGMDARSAAQQMARALESPAMNLNALKSAGIQFTDQEKEQIKTLQEANGLYEAQQVVLGKVKEKFGGVAKSIADTDAGKLDRIGNALNDVKQALGGAIVDQISPYLDSIYNKLVTLQNWIERHTDFDKVNKVLESGGDLSQFGSSILADVRDDTLSQMQALEAKGLLKRDFNGDLIDPSAPLRQWNANGNEGPMPLVSFAEVDAYKQYSALLVKYSKLWKAYRDAEERETNVTEYVPTSATSVDVSNGMTDGTANTFLDKYGSLSPTYQISQAQSAWEQAVVEWGKASGEDKKIKEEIKNALRKKLDDLLEPGDVVDDYLQKNRNLSQTANLEDLRLGVLEAGDQLNAHRGTDDEQIYKEIFDAKNSAYISALYPKTLDIKASQKPVATSAIGDFLSSHSGMSTTMQLADIDSQLAQAKKLQANGGLSDQEADSIQEVIDKLQKQKNELLGISDANEQVKTGAEKYAEAYQSATKYISQATQMLGSFFDLYNQLLSNDVDSLDKQLSDAEERWDKYFDNLERKQDTQKSSLAAMYDEGLISAEDYTSALEDLDEQYTQSQSEREAEEEELQKEADKAKEKQFNANKLNSIAQVLIQGAQATAAVWANPGWPAAIPLTVMLGAMNTAQVATIAAQKYTPMAVGGIVSKPTHAYIGEGAEAEAVMPLSHLSRMLSRQGMDANSGGVINVHISMGDVYDPDQIAEQVYQGINRAQERGMLPAWSVR